ncbi:NosD domain-containing protein [Candidatus Bipolaricaulota sp. J31]
MRPVSWGLVLVVAIWGAGCLRLLAEEEKPNIVVEDNLIAENGLGIYLGWQGDWYIAVVGNRIERNGEGIRLVNRKALIEGNLIADNVIGVRITAEHEEELVTEVEWVTLRGNSFVGNELYAVQNLAPIPVDANENWWGPGGPQPAAPKWTLLPWIFSVSRVPPPLTLRVSPVGEVSEGRFLTLHALGFNGDVDPQTASGAITLDPRDLWGWRMAFIPWTVELSGNLIMGPVEYDEWLPGPPAPGGG